MEDLSEPLVWASSLLLRHLFGDPPPSLASHPILPSFLICLKCSCQGNLSNRAS